MCGGNYVHRSLIKTMRSGELSHNYVHSTYVSISIATLYMVLAVDIMNGHDLSNKVCHSCDKYDPY